MSPHPSHAESHRWLLIDAGNTRTKFGLFDDAPLPPGRLPVCRGYRVVDNRDPAPWAELQAAYGLPANSPGSWSLCLTGSSPRRVDELRASLPPGWPAPVPMPDRDRFPLRIDVDFPLQVGIDRLLNAIAANAFRPPASAAILISSGTATTVDYVNPAGDFCGGAIFPGFELSARSLHEYTALLPLVPLEPLLTAAPPEIGRNTAAAIRSGLYWGHVGAVRELLRRLLHRATLDQESSTREGPRHLGNLAADETPLVLVTGGGAPLLMPHLPAFCREEPYLPLQGLALLMRSTADEQVR